MGFLHESTAHTVLHCSERDSPNSGFREDCRAPDCPESGRVVDCLLEKIIPTLIRKSTDIGLSPASVTPRWY